MEKQAKKNLIIRLIVYPIVIIIIIFLCGFLWTVYVNDYPKQVIRKAYTHWLILKSDYCEEPEETIQRLSKALIKADRDKALEYMHDPISWKQYFYNKSDEEIKILGKDIKKGFLRKQRFPDEAFWVYKHDDYDSCMVELIYLSSDGWKVSFISTERPFE